MLLFEEGADAIFFSDQDDIWLPHKIARQLQSLQEMERQYGPGTPLLCYSDLEVVDQKLDQIHPSFMRYEKLRHESRPSHARSLDSEHRLRLCCRHQSRSFWNSSLLFLMRSFCTIGGWQFALLRVVELVT